MNRRDFFKFGLAGAGILAVTQKAKALEYYPMPSDKKWAVIYGTWCGSSRDAAVWISEGMGGIANVFDVRENPNPADFDHLIIGGSIRYSETRKELQDYIKQNQPLLKERVKALFAVCGNMRQPVGPQQTAQFIDNHLAKLCGVSNVPSKVFLGRITKSLMDPQTAQMMAAMEDYDNLKRSECMAFGREILEKMTSTSGKNEQLPKEFDVGQNYPNPFNSSTHIHYVLNGSGKVKLNVLNAKGEKIRTLLDGYQSPGEYSIQWDGWDDFGKPVSSGSYFYVVMLDENLVAKKMVMIK